MTVAWFGNSTQPSVWFGDRRLIYDPTPPEPGQVVFTTAGGVFAPVIELASGSSATIEWLDTNGTIITTGLTPSITGETVIHMRCSNYDDIATVNLGFNSNDDAGRYNIGASYNKAATDITGVSGLSYLPNLVRFMAASTQLTGHVDFSGLAHLEYIECFVSRVQSVDLTGCTSLIRLCLERTWCSSLDLNPVRHTLRDLRAANQTHNGGSLTFVPLDGPMDVLYHYCIRDQSTVGQYSLGQLPLIEEYWAWGNGQSAMATGAVSPVIRSVPLHGNAYDQASVDRIISSIRSVATSGGQLDLSGSATPSSAVISDIAWLRAHGWTVTLSSEPVTPTLPEPVAAYAFDEGVGSISVDATGNGFDATIDGTWASGHTNGGVMATPSTIAATVAAEILSQPTEKTVMMWLQPIILGGVYFIAFERVAEGGGWYDVMVASITDGSLGVMTNNGNTPFILDEANTFVVGTWIHVAVTISPSESALYVNGTLVQSGAGATEKIGIGRLNMGGVHQYDMYNTATVDDVRIFDVALTSEQVAEYMNTPV